MAHDRPDSPHIGDDLNIEMEDDAMPGIQGGSGSGWLLIKSFERREYCT
jgi:hypothetical protein